MCLRHRLHYLHLHPLHRLHHLHRLHLHHLHLHLHLHLQELEGGEEGEEAREVVAARRRGLQEEVDLRRRVGLEEGRGAEDHLPEA